MERFLWKSHLGRLARGRPSAARKGTGMGTRRQQAHVDRTCEPPRLPAAPAPQMPAWSRGQHLHHSRQHPRHRRQHAHVDSISTTPGSPRATASSPASANHGLRSSREVATTLHQELQQGSRYLWSGRRGPASVGVSAKSVCPQAHSATCSSCQSTPGLESQLRGGKLKLSTSLASVYTQGGGEEWAVGTVKS